MPKSGEIYVFAGKNKNFVQNVLKVLIVFLFEKRLAHNSTVCEKFFRQKEKHAGACISESNPQNKQVFNILNVEKVEIQRMCSAVPG